MRIKGKAAKQVQIGGKEMTDVNMKRTGLDK
jgi:hypothetical protein